MQKVIIVRCLSIVQYCYDSKGFKCKVKMNCIIGETFMWHHLLRTFYSCYNLFKSIHSHSTWVEDWDCIFSKGAMKHEKKLQSWTLHEDALTKTFEGRHFIDWKVHFPFRLDFNFFCWKQTTRSSSILWKFVEICLNAIHIIQWKYLHHLIGHWVKWSSTYIMMQ